MQKHALEKKGNGVSVSLAELVALRQEARQLILAYPPRCQSQQTGEQVIAVKGRGMEFAEVRHYQPGDDVRTIDWRVTARTGKPHTKLFQQERERPVLLVVDLRTPMFFGTQVAFKSIVAMKAAALLGWAATYQGDRLGCLWFTNNHSQWLPPKSRQQTLLPLLNRLAQVSHEQQSLAKTIDFSHHLSHVHRMAKNGHLVILLSDFNGFDEKAERHLLHLNRHNQVLSVCIYDPIERFPPPKNRYTMTNGQNTLSVDTRIPEIAKGYQKCMNRRYQRLETFMHSHRLPLRYLATNESIVDSLRLLLPKEAVYGSSR